MNCDNQCCENHGHEHCHDHHELAGDWYGINVTALAHHPAPLVVEEAAELVPEEMRKPGTKITFWTFDGWQTWQFQPMDVREWVLPESWVQDTEELKDMQNQIDSIQIGGWAISNQLGDDPHIGISQQALTELIGYDHVPNSIRGRIQAVEDEIGTDTTSDSLSGRITALEDAVGTGGSVDARINQAKNQILGDVSADYNTLGKTEDKIKIVDAALNNKINEDIATERSRAIAAEQEEFNRATAAEEQLRQSYEALSQSSIVIGTLPASGESTVIYRVPGVSSYSDYMWNGTQFVKMAEYDNAIDDIPTVNSNNLVKSGGVQSRLAPIEYVYNTNLKQTSNIFTFENIVPGVIIADGTIGPSTGTYTSDFLPVEVGVTYYASYSDTSFHTLVLPVIGFYNGTTFIDRVLQNHVFTVPQNCTHVRVSAGVFYNQDGAENKVSISSKGMVNYEPHRKLEDVALSCDEDIEVLKYITYGLEQYVNNSNVISKFINRNNLWATIVDARSFLLPAKEGQNVSLRNNNKVSVVYAFLKDNSVRTGESPSFVYKYNQIVDETDGSITWKVVEDDYGNPVLDERRLLKTSAEIMEVAPPETAYLYITAVSSIDNVATPSLPIVTIDGVKYNNVSEEEGGSIYSEVFFDDFTSNELNTDKWMMHTQYPASGGRYNSRFKTTATNAYVDQGLLILDCSKTATPEDGTYIFNGNVLPVEYVAPYISTSDSFAIKEGRISVKMKCTKNIADGMYPFCFWTFGQNNSWPYAHEMDVAESACSVSTQDATAKDGTFIPAGSHSSVFANHLHVRTAETADLFKQSMYKLNWAIYNGGVYDTDKDFINKIDPTEWHIYSVEWNKDFISYSVDGKVYTSYDAESLGAIDAEGNTGFFYPQDIRFNIKAAGTTTDEHGYLYIDWVRAETLNLNPCTSIGHDDVELAAGQGIYIQPTFNEGCTNMAYTMNIGTVGSYTGINAAHTKLTHPTAGEVTPSAMTVYMLNTGRYYILDNGLLVECDINGKITGTPEDEVYPLPVAFDNGVVRYQKFNSDAAGQTVHRVVGRFAGTTTVRMLSANKHTTGTFEVTVVN